MTRPLRRLRALLRPAAPGSTAEPEARKAFFDEARAQTPYLAVESNGLLFSSRPATASAAASSPTAGGRT